MGPVARFWRTFAAGMVGVLASVVVFTQTGDYKAGAVVLTLGVATALVAGLAAAALAAAGKTAATPFGKALSTFLQMLGAGFGAVVFNSVADLTSFPKLALTVGVGAVIAAGQTFAQNYSGG